MATITPEVEDQNTPCLNVGLCQVYTEADGLRWLSEVRGRDGAFVDLPIRRFSREVPYALADDPEGDPGQSGQAEFFRDQRALRGAGAVERLYRDNRILAIGGGTYEIMNEVIAKQLGL